MRPSDAMTLLFALLIGLGLLQQDDGDLDWTSYGPNDPGHSRVVIDPADPDARSWYTVTYGGAYHTDDFGETMRPLGEAGMDNQIWSDLALARDRPHVLYAATGWRNFDREEVVRFPGNGVYRSEDHGQSWMRLPLFTGMEDPEDLYFLTSVVTSALGDTVIVSTNRRILRSVDAGQTWTVVHEILPMADPLYPGATLPPYHSFIEHHPRILTHMFLTVVGFISSLDGTHKRDEQYVLETHDGGTTWAPMLHPDGTPLQVEPTSRGIRTVRAKFVLDPADPAVVWMFGRGKAHRSTDGGQTWTTLPVKSKFGKDNDIPASSSIYAHPRGGDTLTYGHHVLHYRGDHLYEDGANAFSEPVVGLLPAPDTYLGYRAIEANPGNPYGYHWLLFWESEEYRAVNLKTGGPYLSNRMYQICRSPDPAGGYVYHYSSPDRSKTPLQPLELPKRSASESRGRIQAHAKAQAPPTGEVRDYRRDSFGYDVIHCHPTRDDMLTGGQPHLGGIRFGDRFLRPSVSTFRDVNFPDRTIRRLSASRQNPDRIWVASRGITGGLWKSEDYSDTWEHVLDDPQAHTVHVHQFDDQVIYTNTAVSKDGGATWEARTLPESTLIGIRDRLYSHPVDTSVLYTCSDDGLRRFENYLQESTLLASAEEVTLCHDILVFPHNPDRIWMGTNSGLWETLDGGKTWARRNRGLPNVPITVITLTYEQDELLIGTYGRGVYQIPATDVDIGFASRVSREADIGLPGEGFMLQGNYPNPFREGTVVGFRAGEAAHIRLEILDVLGRRVATVTDQAYPRGDHQVRWESVQQASGVYFVQMHVDGVLRQSRKVVRR